jgi:hypothetical protein
MKQYLAPGNPWRDVSLNGLRSDALNIAQSEIIDGLRATARDPRLLANTPAAKPDTLDPNIKAVTLNGITTFWGESFVRAMGRPGRRVAGFYTPSGYITTNGTMMR